MLRKSAGMNNNRQQQQRHSPSSSASSQCTQQQSTAHINDQVQYKRTKIQIDDAPNHKSTGVDDFEHHDMSGKEQNSAYTISPHVLKLSKKTGYPVRQHNGQRSYGPHPDDKNFTPPRGCEVFVGKIPRDLYEDEIVPMFETIGKIYTMRLMMDFDGRNRGYCFIMYRQRSHARIAIEKFNNFEIRKGRFLGVCSSVDNCRLFIGGIPKNKSRDEIKREIMNNVNGS